MGTTLTGTTPQDTYDSLIKVTDNGPLSGTAKYLSDGLGNDSGLALSTGNVGIGTTSPAEKLSVAGAIITTGSITGHGANRVSVSQEGANGAFIQSYGANASTVGAFTFRQASSDFSVTQIPLSITAAGNVGIGISAPTNLLHLAGASATPSLRLASVSAGFYWDIGRENATTGDFVFNNASGASSTERMRITSAGLVGIGKTSPTNPLHILKAESSVLLGGLKIERDPNTSTSAIFNAFGGAAFIVANSGVTSSFTSPIVFSVSDNTTTTEIARITSSGLTFNGDSAAANALDDYEEGTWTMGIAFGGASVGATYINNQGRYTKIGRQVNAMGYMAFSNKGSSTGDATLTGLPFTSGAFAAGITPVTLRLENITFTNAFQGFLDTSRTSIDLGEVTILGVASNLTNADFSNSSVIMVSITYTV